MTKVGVATFSNAVDNYGQVLQYLATQEYLRTLGFYAVLLQPTGHRISWVGRNMLRMRNFLGYIKHRITGSRPIIAAEHSANSHEDAKNLEFKRWMDSIERNEKAHPRFFNDFKNRHFNTFVGTYEDILEHGFKFFCVGSDQTWSGPGGYYLFDWVPDACKRFSIAPSVGHWQFADSQLANYKNNLPKFSFITVREENGLELCRKCGRPDAKVVLDPTFLLSSEEYDQFSDPIKMEKEYVLIYMLGGEIAIDVGDIIKYCHEHDLDVKYVASQGREDEYQKCYATVGEWLSLVRDAKYVFTNSFHGMAFSIIYRKQFLVFPLVGIMADMNGRVSGLASRMSLCDRIFNGKLDVVENVIDWNKSKDSIDRNKGELMKMVKMLEDESCG